MPIKGQAYTFVLHLVEAGTSNFKANPTLAAGDFKVSTDFSVRANLATLPTVSPAGSIDVRVDLSAAEMGGNIVILEAKDQTSPAEWATVAVQIETDSAAEARPKGVVVSDATNSTISFKTDINKADDFYVSSWVRFLSGTLEGQSRPISGFNSATKFIRLSRALTSIPTAGDQFEIING